MPRPSLRLLIAPLTGLLLLGGCFLPGGSAPDGCDLEPNDSVVFARGLAYDTDALSCNDGTSDTDLYRLPHQGGADHPIGVACEGGTGATVQLDFLPDGETDLINLIPAFSCDGDRVFLSALVAGTPYVRVFHPDPSSQQVTVSASIPTS
jgi:hypothetical protein